MTIRVAQFGTGYVGGFALRTIIERSDLELTGVWVSNPAKVGKDAGELASLATKTGIFATNSIDDIIASAPRVVCSAAGGDGREAAITDLHCRFLEAGIDVVSTSIVGMIDPVEYTDRQNVEKLRLAALRGGSTYYTSGIEPGIMSDALPILLASMTSHFRTIRIREILDYSTYRPSEIEKIMGDVLGFGRPLDFVPLLLQPERLKLVWSSPLTLFGRACGFRFDEIVERSWREPATDSYEIPGFALISKGTAEALRFEIAGRIAGKDVVVIEHITRLRAAAAPQWTQGTSGPGYYVNVDGDPRIDCYVRCVGQSGDHQDGVITATAMRVVNAIPAVAAAAPGIISMLDLPFYGATAAYRP
jgi:2,4-diaminopentanoate dehydrogenase